MVLLFSNAVVVLLFSNAVVVLLFSNAVVVLLFSNAVVVLLFSNAVVVLLFSNAVVVLRLSFICTHTSIIMKTTGTHSLYLATPMLTQLTGLVIDKKKEEK